MSTSLMHVKNTQFKNYLLPWSFQIKSQESTRVSLQKRPISKQNNSEASKHHLQIPTHDGGRPNALARACDRGHGHTNCPGNPNLCPGTELFRIHSENDQQEILCQRPTHVFKEAKVSSAPAASYQNGEDNMLGRRRDRAEFSSARPALALYVTDKTRALPFTFGGSGDQHRRNSCQA